MSDKDYSQLTSAVTLDDTDLFAKYPTGGPLKKVTWATLKGLIATAIGGTYLTIANSLSDLASASAARANLGLGTAATLASGALFQVANNLSEVSNAATARANIGAAASASPVITGGLTQDGSTKQGVLAVSGTSLDFSLQDVFTKSISADTTFTFTGFTAAKAQGAILDLTISSAAAVTWPASVKWSSGVAPSLGNGRHIIGLITDDGGTTVVGILGAVAVA